MSDENAGDELEASANLEIGAGDDVDGDGSAELAVVGDPALASRLETIHRTMSTLGMRIDALVTSTTSYRSALTDRLTEYADLVTKLTRSQASDLEEYRRNNERTLSDLRRGLSTSEESLERVSARIESMLTDAESADDTSRRMLAEVRSILDAQESLGRFLTESLDQFGDQVVNRLTAAEQASSAQVDALREALADLAGTPSPELEGLGGRLAGIEQRLGALADADPSAALAGRFDAMHAAVDDLGTRLRSGLDELGAIDVVAQLEQLQRDVSATGKVATESWGEFAGVRSKVDTILETSANQSGAVNEALEQLKETLLDVASGEVVGALWDEFRQVRATIEALVDQTGRTAPPEAVDALRDDVTDLTESVRTLLEQAEVVDEDGIGEAEGGYLTALAADVASLRRELQQGMIVEPSDAFGSSVDRLRADVSTIGDRLGAVDELADAVAELRQSAGEPGSGGDAVIAELRDRLDSLRDHVDQATERQVDALAKLADGPDRGDAGASLGEEVEAELRTLRSGVEDIIARLDEGLVLADDGPAGAAGASPELADQLATLRDTIGTEFEALRTSMGQLPSGDGVDLTPLTARLDRLHDDLSEIEIPEPSGAATDLSPVLTALDELQQAVGHLLDRPVSAPSAADGGSAGFSTLDPDVVDVLRDEIRSAGGASDEAFETLAAELKALRRRIRLRAEGEIFSDDQLELIAEAVARRLAE